MSKAEEAAAKRRAYVQDTADELMMSWLNGNRSHVLDELTYAGTVPAREQRVLTERVALAAELMWNLHVNGHNVAAGEVSGALLGRASDG